MPSTPTLPPSPAIKADNAAFVRARRLRITEDIAAAESKSKRIRNPISRDRQALLLWQARLTGIQDEQRPAQ